MRRIHPLVALVALLVAVAPAQAASPQLRPAPDANVDVAAVRGIQPASRTASSRSMRAAAATTPAGRSLDLRVLLMSAEGTDPTFTWWKTTLQREGVPFDAFIATAEPELTAARLRRAADHGRYQAVVLSNGALVYTPDGGATWPSALSTQEWGVLAAYEAEFGVREVDAYVYPQPAYGLEWTSIAGDQSGTTLQVSAAGRSVFTDLVGPVPVDRWTYGYRATPMAGFQTLVSSGGHAIVGTYTRPDGTEALVSTIDGNDWALHSNLLVRGMLEWATRGVHLGQRRAYLGIDVDDVFLGDDRWNPDANATAENGPNPIRMTPADVDRVLAWQQSSGIRLNLLFNADGAKPGDPLTQRLLADKNAFRWTSHTFTHLNLDGRPLQTIREEIWKNIDWAHEQGLPNFDETEVTTGEHSGLTNPAMAQAFTDTGIRWFGSDNSRTPQQSPIGPAMSVPRHPTGIYYNVGTRAEQLDEYNWINFENCGGAPRCLPGLADWNTYVDNEATIILRHVLGNDPRPHYVHQNNLAEDGTMYPVIDEVLRRYRAYLKPSLVQLGTRGAGEELLRQSTWASAVAAGNVSATIGPDGNVVVSTASPIAVPFTRGATSGWTGVPAGTTPIGGAPAPAPDPQPAPDPAPAPTPSPGLTGIYANLVAGDGAFALWRLDDDGGDIRDSIGGFTGYWRNGPPALAEGIEFNAAGFDGGPAYGEINGVAAPQRAYTLEAWVRPGGRRDMAIVEHGAAGALAIIGGRLTFRHVRDDVAASWEVEPGLWYHVAGVWDGRELALYVDGERRATAASSARPSGSATLYLGRGAISGNLQGRLDDVAYYDRALTAAQVAKHADTGHHLPPQWAKTAAPEPAAGEASAAAAAGDAPSERSAPPATVGRQSSSVGRVSQPKAATTKAKKARKAKRAARRGKARQAKRRGAAARRAGARARS